jgi:hypothetical protein
MPSRVWLAAAFVIAFGASPAHAAMERAAGKPLDVHPGGETVSALQIRFSRVSCACKPDDTPVVELGDDPNASAEKRARIAVAD